MYVPEGLFVKGIKLQYSVALYQCNLIQKDKHIVFELALP